jgi:hypothetical protein
VKVQVCAKRLDTTVLDKDFEASIVDNRQVVYMLSIGKNYLSNVSAARTYRRTN